jgi:phenylacetate-CoA ligase
MNIQFAKKYLKDLLYPIGNLLSKIPYQNRPGSKEVYGSSSNNINNIYKFQADENKAFIFINVYKVTCYAYDNVGFYSDLYNKWSFNPHKMKHFLDIENIPIVDKSQLKAVPLVARSCINKNKKYSLSNTGGSPGTPFEFYVNKEVTGNEWAHLHSFWKKFGYNSSSLKFYFGGRTGVVGEGKYDSLRHHFSVNINLHWKQIADYLLVIFDKYSPKFLHGHFSCIFDFLLWLDKNNHPLKFILQRKVAAVFLASVYLNPNLRKLVNEIYSFKSWAH